MPSEHESDVARWLDSPEARREIAIVRKRFPAWRGADPYLFTLMIEILSALDFYGTSSLEDENDEPGDEPWKP